MGRRSTRATLLGLGTVASLLLTVPPAGASTPPQWTDVQPGSRAWFAKAAINHVAGAEDWMRDYGPHSFHPNGSETRGFLARAVVRAFAPTQTTETGLRFGDLSLEDPLYPYANVAVSNGWMTSSGGKFEPDAPVDEFTVSKAMVLALGLKDEVKGANGIHTTNGRLLEHSSRFGVYLMGRVLGLWRNHDPDIRGDSEAYDLLPTSEVPRSDVAYALHRASQLGDSAHWYADQYADIDVGSPSPAMQKVIEFGMKYVGYPYVYAGEWNTPSYPGYCCGTQLQGGFDCSGFTWWLMRAGDSAWNNTVIRGYPGWSLPERSSSQMAAAIKKWQRIPYMRLLPGDLMLYGSGPTAIYHVDTYIGNGWALDSGGNGVTIVNVSSGWYRETFQFGRRIVSPS